MNDSRKALVALSVLFAIVATTAIFLLWYVGSHEYSNPLDMMR